MPPTKELIDGIYHERILRARRTAPGRKVVDGLHLFDLACKVMKCGIRDQFPDADEARVDAILRERIDRLRKLDERGFYRVQQEVA